MNTRTLLFKISRKLLQLRFGFDKWHISPLAERPYAIDIISYCNNRKERDKFAEIGCGLGDIIRNVDYRTRNGFDNDEKVLRAARTLPVVNRKNSTVIFGEFNFPDSKLTGQYDVITMVNWIHHIQPATLKKYIEQYFAYNLNADGEIIIDTVQDKAYRYNHNIAFLTEGLQCSTHRIGSYAREREVFAIKK